MTLAPFRPIAGLAMALLLASPVAAQGPVSADRANAVLRDVPVFIPMDSSGTPVVATPPDGGKPVVGLFLRKAGAVSFVSNLRQSRPEIARRVVIRTASLGNALRMLGVRVFPKPPKPLVVRVEGSLFQNLVSDVPIRQLLALPFHRWGAASLEGPNAFAFGPASSGARSLGERARREGRFFFAKPAGCRAAHSRSSQAHRRRPGRDGRRRCPSRRGLAWKEGDDAARGGGPFALGLGCRDGSS